jgi:glycosyltransferase involved in cell wall biosynthesis
LHGPVAVATRYRIRRIRVLMVNKAAWVLGGAEQYCLMLTRGLRERGHEVQWLSVFAEANEESAGAFVPRVGGVRRAARALWCGPAAGATRALVERFAPDVIHTNMLYSQLSVAPVVVARRLGVPVVQTIHGYELISASSADERGRWIDWSPIGAADRVINTATFPLKRLVHLRAVDEFIAVSSYVAGVFARYVRSHVVPNAIPPLEGRLPGFDERRGVLFVGRFYREKGADHVLELAQRRPDLRVTMVGTGPLWTQAQALAERLPNLTLTGWLPHEQIAELVRSARVSVMPSRYGEPAPIAALEAFAAGTPLVAYPFGGLPEMTSAGGGWIVDADPAALADACGRLHEDRRAWERSSTLGRAAVTEGPFSMHRFLDGTEQVYERAIGRRSAL